MVKTRSSARVGSKVSGQSSGAAAQNGDANAAADAMARENGHRNQSTYMRQNQTGGSNAGSGGAGAPGNKDVSSVQSPNPLANASMVNAMSSLMNQPRSLFHHSPGAPSSQYVSVQDRSMMQVPQPRNTSMYSQNMYHQYPQQTQQQMTIMDKPSSTGMHYPVHPDVKMKKLPFYDVISEIMKPSTLMPTPNQRMQESNFYFHLTPHQASDIATGRDIIGVSNKLENIVQAQLRFCLLETSCEQEDCFPPSVVVKVNNKTCPLPNPIPTNKQGVEPKRPPRPVNITSLLKLSPTVSNSLIIQWAVDFSKGYAISISLVRKLTSAELLQRLKNKGTKNPDYTRSIIKEKLSEDYDCEIATTCLRVSLMCPLGKMKMQVPCRPQTCSHLQCFDASIFLQMNERKPTWSCPVCDKPAIYDSLVVDGYFMEVLSSSRLPSGCSDIQLNKDGSWSAQSPKKAAPISSPSSAVHTTSSDNNIEIISDDVEVIPLESGSAPPAKRLAVSSSAGADEKPKPANVVDLTSDSDDDLPLKRKVPDSSSQHQDNKFNEGTAVTSSGYQSPGEGGNNAAGNSSPQAIISLDSPSPPQAPSSPVALISTSPGPTSAADDGKRNSSPTQSSLRPQLSINPLAVSGNVNGTRLSPEPAHQSSNPRVVSSVSPSHSGQWPSTSPSAYRPDAATASPTETTTTEVPLLTTETYPGY